MTYANRRIWDADSHLMETPDWLVSYADTRIRGRIRELMDMSKHRQAHLPAGSEPSAAERRRSNPDAVTEAEAQLMTAKEWAALGSSDPVERSRAIDLLGFEIQLVFSTLAYAQFEGRDLQLLYGGLDAHNRGIADFCAHDERMIPIGAIALVDPERDVLTLDRALQAGCQGILIPRENAGDLSPTHPAFDPIWARLEEASVPFMVHVAIGSDGRFFHRPFYNNGHPRTDGFTVEGETIQSKDFMSLHYAARTLLSVMALDGLFERFPRLRGGCIEFGALWVITWLRQLDWTQRVFARSEPELALPLSASEYIRRAVKFTPYSGEPVDWMVEQAGEELFMFSTDYPHPEGGRNPLSRFMESTATIGNAAAERFYWGNLADLLGRPAGVGMQS